jgi:AcrR family transcriptional regulator
MTPERADPSAPADLSINERSVAFEDLTARARIREAALEHFALDGYDRATTRAIAKTAGVSQGQLRHHYGSKEALREACDRYVFEALHRANAQLLDDPGATVQIQQATKPFGRYVARSLADGSPTVGPIFDELVTMTEAWLVRADSSRKDTPTIDQRVRAALVTAMKIGIPLLHEHVSRALGTDMFGPEGDRLIALALLDIYSHALIDDDVSTSAAAGDDKPHGRPDPSSRARD